MQDHPDRILSWSCLMHARRVFVSTYKDLAEGHADEGSQSHNNKLCQRCGLKTVTII